MVIIVRVHAHKELKFFWNLEKHQHCLVFFHMARAAGFEPATWGLTVPRSTAELRPNT